MNYRLAIVFSYERFETALICIISFEPSSRFRPILNIPVFRKNGASLDLLNIVFKIVYQKGFFWWDKKKSNLLIWGRILDIYWERFLNFCVRVLLKSAIFEKLNLINLCKYLSQIMTIRFQQFCLIFFLFDRNWHNCICRISRLQLFERSLPYEFVWGL